ncbi:MAG: glycoside hydrolase family 5 protein [Fibrobacteria bacterium]|nr:glycoside hydrolase family 5 protein [Fibrobacteria bacterium]
METHGDLSIVKGKLVDKTGEPVQLAGPSLYWSVWGGQDYYNRSTIDWITSDWKATLVRAAMGVDVNQRYDKGYLAAPDAQVQLVKTVVDAAIANGIYVLVDWHDHDANLHVEQAKAFFETMGQAYGNTPNVIWEIWNEPNNTGGSGEKGKDTWTDIRNYAEQVIPVIRKHSKNVIVVGTPNWSQEVDSAAANPLTGDNLAYTLHFYAGTHKISLRTKAEGAMRKGLALFITEWGATTSDGGQHPSTSNGNVDNFKIYPTETATWLNWADKWNLSWANWSLSNKDEASAALLASTSGTTGNWGTEQLSESGNLVRSRLIAMDSIAKAKALSIPARSTSGSRFQVETTPGFLHVASSEGTARIRILRATGEQLLQGEAGPSGSAWTLDPGLVIVVLEGNGTRETRRVMIP